jgi:hypothetical protein
MCFMEEPRWKPAPPPCFQGVGRVQKRALTCCPCLHNLPIGIVRIKRLILCQSLAAYGRYGRPYGQRRVDQLRQTRTLVSRKGSHDRHARGRGTSAAVLFQRRAGEVRQHDRRRPREMHSRGEGRRRRDRQQPDQPVPSGSSSFWQRKCGAEEAVAQYCSLQQAPLRRAFHFYSAVRMTNMTSRSRTLRFQIPASELSARVCRRNVVTDGRRP